MQLSQKIEGYTMVLFLAFIASVLLAGFSLYDNGTVAAERIRIQNTTDATAYSTVNVISRDMNFIAYTNRSMVANQVAIGQMVGLSSWFHMLDQSADNLDTVAKITYLFPPVGAFVNRITSAIRQATELAKNFVDKAATAVIDYGLEYILTILSGAQDAFQVATFDMALATFNEVSKANDVDIKKGLVASAYSMVKLVESWENEIERNNVASSKSGKANKRKTKRFREFANVVSSSRDRFTQNRSYNWLNPIGIDIGIVAYKLSIQKKGGSDFMQVKAKNKKFQWEWTAMDTVSVWQDAKWIGTCSKWGVSYPCQKHKYFEMVPLGWGAGHALNEDRNGNKKQFYYSNYSGSKQASFYDKGMQTKPLTKLKSWGNGAFTNRYAAYPAAAYDVGNNRANTKGLRSFYDLKSDIKKDTGPNLVTMLMKPRNKMQLQETLDDDDSKYNRSQLMQIEEQGSVMNDHTYGLSKAETYFSRPRDIWERKDTYREYGNLYNPFWQTRLIETGAEERAAAIISAAVSK